MKKKYIKLLSLLVLLTGVSAEVSAQDDLKKSNFSNQIKEHLTLKKYDLTNNDIQNLYVDSEYLSKKTQITHVYVGQQHEGVKVFNAISSIAIKDGKVFYVGNSFVNNVSDKVNSESPIISQLQAINIVATQFRMPLVSDLKVIKSEKNKYTYSKGNLFLEDIPVKLVYSSSEEGVLKLSWDVSLYALDGKHNWSARVDALTGNILEYNDLVITCDFGTPGHVHSKGSGHAISESKSNFELFKTEESVMVDGANYRVYALPAESPNHVAGSTLVTDPENIAASPFGWHDTDGVSGPEYTITRGNNVHAYDDSGNNNGSIGNEPDGTATLSFDFPSNLAQAPTTPQNLAANTTNVFYMSNMMHDIYYNYGFDEAAGNFQQNNYGNGGIGGDYVLAEAQDGGGTNNANFSTPADGGNGRMQMYLWTAGNPDRDGDLDNGIIAHEYGHGIHTRLGGGPNNSGCMQNNEQQGEGWADWFGLMITIEPGDVGADGRGIGTFAIGQGVNGGGIRTYRYSTNTAINPHTYDDIKTEAVPHGVGSVWCAMLWDLTWAYIDKYGYDPDLYNGTGGNNKVMQLVLDGLKLQPCSSGFVDSRDALLCADVALTGGQDQCLIWEVFAARGLGASADQGSSASNTDGTEAFDMPLASIKATVTPDTCGSDSVELMLSNLNTNAISQFDYNYSIDGGASVANSWSGNINSCSVASGIPFNYGTLTRGTHEITVTGTNPVTTSTSFFVNVNDLGTENVINTFESTVDNLVAYDGSGSVSTWERGDAYDPNFGRTLTSTVTGGSKVYGTNLDGIHGDQSKFYLVSQCYDLSALENTFVKFDLAFDIEQDWDILYMEYSTDGGSSWSVLGTAADTDWYNSTRLPNGTDCFNCIGKQWTGEAADASTHSDGGTVGTMHNYSYSLSAFDSTGSSESSIVFRFTYHADDAYAEEGAVIDNFVVTGDIPLSMNDNEFDKLSIFPNPTNGVITIISSSSLNDAKVSVYDVMGRNLTNNTNLTVKDSNSISVDINGFAGGTYILSIEDQNHKSVKQIVKY
jgi:hypothetical protein